MASTTYVVPNLSDLTDTEGSTAYDFMAFTPSAINVQDFYVIITPMEDPYRAFAEEDVQVQPQVTLIMTVTLSEDYSGNLLGEVPSLTLQRTISTGVYGEVISYE